MKANEASLAALALACFAVIVAQIETDGRAALLKARNQYAVTYAHLELSKDVEKGTADHWLGEMPRNGDSYVTRTRHYITGVGRHDLVIRRQDMRDVHSPKALLRFRCDLRVDNLALQVSWERRDMPCIHLMDGEWKVPMPGGARQSLGELAERVGVRHLREDDFMVLQAGIERQLATRTVNVPLLGVQLSAKAAAWPIAVLALALTVLVLRGIRKQAGNKLADKDAESWIVMDAETYPEQCLGFLWLILLCIAPIAAVMATLIIQTSIAADRQDSPFATLAQLVVVAVLLVLSIVLSKTVFANALAARRTTVAGVRAKRPQR